MGGKEAVMLTRTELALRQYEYNAKAKPRTWQAIVLLIASGLLVLMSVLRLSGVLATRRNAFPSTEEGVYTITVLKLIFNLIVFGFALYCLFRNARLRRDLDLNCPTCGKAMIGRRGDLTLDTFRCGWCEATVLTPDPARAGIVG
jgi:hypothetical protein